MLFGIPAPDGGTQAVEMQVSAVEDRMPQSPGRQFAILFTGPLAPQLPQRTYRMRHAQQGDFAIFMTPTARTGTHMVYEACFALAA